MLTRHIERCLRGAAKVDRHMWLLQWLDFGIAFFETVILAFMIKRLVLGPNAFEDAKVFVSARIAFVVIEIVAVAFLLIVGTARDEMHAKPPPAESIERGD